jgi:hypothetical protein
MCKPFPFAGSESDWLKPKRLAVGGAQIQFAESAHRDVLKNSVYGNINRVLGGTIRVRDTALQALIDVEELMTKVRIDLEEDCLPLGFIAMPS